MKEERVPYTWKLKDRRHVSNIFSNLFFQSPRDEEFFRNDFKILYCPNITVQFSTVMTVSLQ
jgi:hypothetical protein